MIILEKLFTIALVWKGFVFIYLYLNALILAFNTIFVLQNNICEFTTRRNIQKFVIYPKTGFDFGYSQIWYGELNQ